MRLMNRDMDEVDIEEYLLTGDTSLGEKYKKIIDTEIIRFTDTVYNPMNESGWFWMNNERKRKNMVENE